MSDNSIFWLPICAVLTALGLVLSYYVGRRRGNNRAMLRGAAWSLIPIAAYLTGSVTMFWKIGDAVGNFASGFVFSPVKWAGIAVTGFAALLFVATGGRERRKAARLKASARAGQKKSAASGSQQGLAATSELAVGDGAGAANTTAALPVARKAEPAKTPSGKHRGKSSAPADDDMRDIEDILRKRGI